MEVLDVREGNERRKRLLQQLLAQAQQQQAVGGGVGAPAFAQMFRRAPLGASRIARNRSDARTARPGITLATQINPRLAHALGAAQGRGNQHDRSQGPGLPVTPPPRLQTLDPNRVGGPALPHGNDILGPLQGAPVRPPGEVPSDSAGISRSPETGAVFVPMSAPQPESANVGSNLIPVAPGVFYDVANDVMRGSGFRF